MHVNALLSSCFVLVPKQRPDHANPTGRWNEFILVHYGLYVYIYIVLYLFFKNYFDSLKSNKLPERKKKCIMVKYPPGSFGRINQFTNFFFFTARVKKKLLKEKIRSKCLPEGEKKEIRFDGWLLMTETISTFFFFLIFYFFVLKKEKKNIRNF